MKHYLTAIAFTAAGDAVGGCRCGIAFQVPQENWAEVWLRHMEPGGLEPQEGESE